MTTLGRRTWLVRFHETAPVVSLACALVIPLVLPHEPARVDDDGVDLRMIAAAVEGVPYRIGPWVSQDIAVPEAARRLLRPNAMLSRRYVDLKSGIGVELVVVHCGDSRDMLGHYPPVCYPSNGWVTTSRFTGRPDHEHGSETALRLNDLTIPARQYGFSRVHSWSDERHIRIFNFFILPDGKLTSDIEDVGLRVNWLGASVQGVAQVQILTDARLPHESAAQAASEILEGLVALFDSLGVKSIDGSDHDQAKRSQSK